MERKYFKRKQYQIGVVSADTKQELGNACVAHVGLSVRDSELEKNIGRVITFKVREGQGTIHREQHTILGVQRMWGYDENGVYNFNEIGYRVSQGADDFGMAAHPQDIIFIN